MNEEINKIQMNIRLWKRVATVAAVFSVLVCVLIVANYVQLNRQDPVDNLMIDRLVERLSQNPSDQELRQEIRELDLLARKAYFANQWQIRFGGYMLLVGIAVLIIAMQMIRSNEQKHLPVELGPEEDLMHTQKLSRRWVYGFSILIVGGALILAFLTHRQLGDHFRQAAMAARIENAAEEQEQTAELRQQQNQAAVLQATENKPEEMADKNDQIPANQEIEPKSAESASSPQEKQAKKSAEQPVQEESNPETVSEEPAGNASSVSAAIGTRFNAFRGPGSNGISYDKNIPVDWNGETGENIRWKIPLPLPGFNSPVIWNDKLFLTGAKADQKEVYCLDRHSGEILWRAKVENVPGSPASPPDVPDYTGHAASTVAVDGKNVYAIFFDGDMAAFDFEGNPVWSRNLGVPDNHYGYASSLIAYNGMVLIQYDQRNVAKVMALSGASGETVWETPRDVKISWASPVLVETPFGKELILAADPFVISYDPDTGKERWRKKCLSGEVGPSVAYAGGMVFALNEYASLVAIKLGDDPEVVWEDMDYLSDVPSPVATEQYLFAPTSWGMMVCYDTQTGEKLWEAEYDNSIYASPVIAEDKVFLLDRAGVMHIFEVSGEYTEVAASPLGENSVCTPAFADGRIYIRGEQNLYCIE